MLCWAIASGTPLLRYGGTFAISTLSKSGAAIVDSVSVLPSLLSYGPIHADGRVEIFLSFDHRVMHGADGAAGLAAIQAAMEGLVAEELWALSLSAAVSSAPRGSASPPLLPQPAAMT